MSLQIINSKDRYSAPIVTAGKEQSVRQFFTVANRIAPVQARVIESVYRYMRVLDDLVDESPRIRPVISLLKNEKRALAQGAYSALQEELAVDGLSRLPGHRRDRVQNYMSDVMSGMGIDAAVRFNQIPLTQRQVTRRNILDLWSVVACFGVAFSDRNPRLTGDTKKLIDAWGTYDNISDLTEDLTHGLNLVSAEDHISYNLRFEPGKLLPNADLDYYYRSKRVGVMKTLRRYSSSILKSDLPAWASGVFYLYFLSRSLKLNKPMKLLPDAVYTPPIDSVNLSPQVINNSHN